MKNEELKEDLLKRLAKQRTVQAERGEEWQNDLQGQLQGQSSQVRQSSLEGQSSRKLERQSSFESQKGELPSLPHQRTIRRWIRVLSAGWDHLHKTVARYFDILKSK